MIKTTRMTLMLGRQFNTNKYPKLLKKQYLVNAIRTFLRIQNFHTFTGIFTANMSQLLLGSSH